MNWFCGDIGCSSKWNKYPEESVYRLPTVEIRYGGKREEKTTTCGCQILQELSPTFSCFFIFSSTYFVDSRQSLKRLFKVEVLLITIPSNSTKLWHNGKLADLFTPSPSSCDLFPFYHFLGHLPLVSVAS